MRFSKAVVKYRVAILIVALALLAPAVLGMVNTRINYDMLDYLPEDMDTVIGQNELLNDFGKGAFSLVIVEDMPAKDVAALKEKIAEVEHVDSVVWYDSIADLRLPMELLPDSVYQKFNTDNATLMAVFFDSATSADVTMDAIRQIRSLAGQQCFVTGMSALVTDLKDLCEQEEPVYVGLAVLLACAAMMLLLDSWLAPLVFLFSIGVSIVYNLGTNVMLGEISYITKAMAAVLQLAVTMDYSIFLWHSYNEQREKVSDPNEAMANAVHATLSSVVGSSATGLRRPVLHELHAGQGSGPGDGQGRAAGRAGLRYPAALADPAAGPSFAEDPPSSPDPERRRLCQGHRQGFPRDAGDLRAAGLSGSVRLPEDQRRGLLRYGSMPASGY